MNILETLCISGLFATIFIFGEDFDFFYRSHRRRAISAAGGAAVAYVFIHLLPDLARAGDKFVEITADQPLPIPEYRVYVSALAGFVVFYGLEHMIRWSHLTEKPQQEEHSITHPVFLLHIGGFAFYAALISYLMVRSIDETAVPILIYGIAMSLHFLSVEHMLNREHGRIYDKFGKWVLAAAALIGWAFAIWVEFPKPVVITLLGFVSGGVVMNSMIVELPGEKNGRFGAFCLGAAAYTTLLFFV